MDLEQDFDNVAQPPRFPRLAMFMTVLLVGHDQLAMNVIERIFEQTKFSTIFDPLANISHRSPSSCDNATLYFPIPRTGPDTTVCPSIDATFLANVLRCQPNENLRFTANSVPKFDGYESLKCRRAQTFPRESTLGGVFTSDSTLHGHLESFLRVWGDSYSSPKEGQLPTKLPTPLRILQLIRDPRAILVSRYHAGFGQPKELSLESPDSSEARDRLRLWARDMCGKTSRDLNAASEINAKAAPSPADRRHHGRPQVHVIRYEDLARSPLNTLTTLFDFIGVDIPQTLVSSLMQRAACKAPNRGCPQWNDSIDGGVLNQSLAQSAFRWQAELPAWQASVVAAECDGLVEGSRRRMSSDPGNVRRLGPLQKFSHVLSHPEHKLVFQHVMTPVTPAAGFHEEHKLGWSSLPKVFIVPISPRFNTDMYNRTWSCGWQASQFDLRDPNSMSEYAQDILFHWEILRYPKLVSDPEDADIFYVPFYYVWIGAFCNLTTTVGATTVENEFRREIEVWMMLYPPIEAGSPRFFTMAPRTCSCSLVPERDDPYAAITCNPLMEWPSLGRQLRVLAWELQPPCDATCVKNRRRDWWLPENVVVPYHCTGVSRPTGERDPRTTLVLNTALNAYQGRRHCTHCSVCNVSYSIQTCPVGCAGLRPMLGKQANTARNKVIPMSTDHFSSLGIETTVEVLKGDRRNGMAQAQKRRSIFCLEPFGDTMTRRSVYEDIILGCIPVVFRNDPTYLNHMAFSERIPYRSMWVYIPQSDVLAGLDVISVLSKIPLHTILKKQELLRYWAPALSFSDVSVIQPKSEPYIPAPRSSKVSGTVAPNALLLTLEAVHLAALNVRDLQRQQAFSESPKVRPAELNSSNVLPNQKPTEKIAPMGATTLPNQKPTEKISPMGATTLPNQKPTEKSAPMSTTTPPN